MGFPIIQSVTPYSFPERSKSHPVTLPPVDAGDLLVAFFVNHGDTELTNPFGGGPWVVLSINNGRNVRFGAYWKKALAEDAGAVVDFSTYAAAKAAAQVYRVKGWRDSGVIFKDVNITHNQSIPTVTPDPGPLYLWSWGLEDTLWIAAYGADGDEEVMEYPVDDDGVAYEDGLYVESDHSQTSCSMATAHRNRVVLVEDPGGTFPVVPPVHPFKTTGAQAWVAFTMGIRPTII